MDGVGAHTVITGSVTSTTLIFTVHWSVLPEPSVAVKVIVVVPKPKVEPTAGDCVIVGEPVQLSVAVTAPVKLGAVPWQEPLPTILIGDAQTVITGSVTSLTTTSNE